MHDGTKRGEGRPKNGVENTPLTKLHANTKAGARQQLRSYASDPKRCERYGKDHALCQEAWSAVERGEMSVNEGRIHCGLQKPEPARQFYVTKDLERLADRMVAAMPADDLQQLITIIQEKLNDL